MSANSANEHIYVNFENDCAVTYRPIRVTCGAHMQLLAAQFNGAILDADEPVDILALADPMLPFELMKITANRSTRLLSTAEVDPASLVSSRGMPMAKGKQWAMWVNGPHLTILFLPADFPTWTRADWVLFDRQADGHLGVCTYQRVFGS